MKSLVHLECSRRGRASLMVAAGFAAALAGCGGGGSHSVADPIEVSVENLNQESRAGFEAARSVLQDALGDGSVAEDHDMARLLLSVVRLVLFLDDNDGSSTLGRLFDDMEINLYGQFILDFLSEDDLPTSGPELSESFPHVSRFQDFLSQDLAGELVRAAEELESVSEDFSENLTGLNDLPETEFDYGDCQLAASGLRFMTAVLYLQAVIDLEADLYPIYVRADEYSEDPDSLEPYRLYCGLSPDNILPGMPSSSGREGFLNSADHPALGDDVLSSSNTFNVSAEAQALLNSMKSALLHGIDDLVRGMLYEEDGDSADDASYVTDEARIRFEQGQPWLEDVRAAIAGERLFVPDGSFFDGEEIITLPGFVLDPDLVFGSDTYAGRVFLPDYTGTPTVADLDSFHHVESSDLMLLYYNFTSGEILEAEQLLEFWNDLNVAWDEIWVGYPLEYAY